MGDLVFPNSFAAWIFWLLLVGALIPASIIDWKTLLIPKYLSVPIMCAGPVVNVVRGVWLGAHDQQVFLFAPSGAVLGALDGVLFSVVGFVLGYGVFFLLWLLRTCGGGDVKLFAGIGAWVGPVEAIRILIGSQVVVAVILVGQLIRRGRVRARPGDKSGKRKETVAEKKRKRLVSFSLPLAVATAIVLMWDFRYDLGLAEPPAGRTTGQIHESV